MFQPGHQNIDATTGMRDISMRVMTSELPQVKAALSALVAGKARAPEMIVKLFRRMDDALASVPRPLGPALACKPGCSYCCHYRVSISVPEALRLAEYVATKLQPAVRLEVTGRTRERAEQVKGLSAEEHVKTNVRCALLGDDDKCLAYDARPGACRKHHSFDVTPCVETFEDPDHPGENPQSPNILGIGDGVISALHLGLNQAGLDAARYELHEALDACLSQPATEKRWRNGKSAFPGATTRDASTVFDPQTLIRGLADPRRAGDTLPG